MTEPTKPSVADVVKDLQTLAGVGCSGSSVPFVTADRVQHLVALTEIVQPGDSWPASGAKAIDRALVGLAGRRHPSASLDADYVARVFLGIEPIETDPNRKSTKYGLRVTALRKKAKLRGLEKTWQRIIPGLTKLLLAEQLVALEPPAVLGDQDPKEVAVSAAPTFIRRSADEERLRQAFTDSRRMTWVYGDVGVGKSALVQEVALELFGADVMSVRADTLRHYRTDLSQLVRRVTGVASTDNIGLLEESTSEILRNATYAERLLILDDLDAGLASDLLADPSQLEARLVVTSRQPPPDELADAVVRVRVTDMDVDTAAQLVQLHLPHVAQDNWRRLATVVFGRPDAVVRACDYVERNPSLDLEVFYQDLLEPSRALKSLSMVTNRASHVLAGVIATLTEALAANPDALFVLDTIVVSSPWTTYPLALLKRLWLQAPDVKISGDIDDSLHRDLFTKHGASINWVGAKHRALSQFDEMRLTDAVDALVATGLIERDDEFLSISRFALHVISLSRAEALAIHRQIVIEAFRTEQLNWHWSPGETLPTLLADWVLRLPVPDDFMADDPSDETYRTWAMCGRAVRQLRVDADWMLAPIEAAWGERVLDGLPSFEVCPGQTVISKHVPILIEQVRLLSADGRLTKAAEIIDAVDEANLRFPELTRMIASELSPCAAITNVDYIDVFEELSAKRSAEFENLDPEQEVKFEGGLRLPKDLYSCGKVALGRSMFVPAAHLFHKSAQAYRRVGGSVHAIAGEFLALAAAADALLRAGDLQNAAIVLEQTADLGRWHDELVEAGAPSFQVRDLRVDCAVDTVRREMALSLLARNLLTMSRAAEFGDTNISSIVRQRHGHCKGLADIPGEHGFTLMHADELVRCVLIGMLFNARKMLGQDELEVELQEDRNPFWIDASASRWLRDYRRELLSIDCKFGYRQLTLNLRLLELANLAMMSEIGVDPDEYLGLSVGRIQALTSDTLGVELRSSLEDDPSYREYLARENLLPTAAGFQSLAESFKNEDCSPYWHARALTAAAYCEASRICVSVGGEGVIDDALSAAASMARPDWRESILLAGDNLLQALSVLCSL